MNNLLPDEVLFRTIDREKQYFMDNPKSCVKEFLDCLRELGFQFSVSMQITQFMPKHKDVILPLTVKYYELAETKHERNYFISLMRYPCCKAVVSKLLDSFYKGTSIDDRECISECIYSIHDKSYAEEYLSIISNEEYGLHRAMFVLLLGRLKYQRAVDEIITLLQDSSLCKYAIIALGNYQNKEFRDYITKYVNSSDPYLSKYAKQALQRMDI